MAIFRKTPQVARIACSSIFSFCWSRDDFTLGIPLGVTISFLLQGTVIVPLFPDTYRTAFVIVMFLKGTFAVKMPTFPIPHRMVVFIIEIRLDFLVTKESRPLSVLEALLIVSEQSHVAKARPAFEISVRDPVLVGNFKFLDAIGVPFVPFQDFAVGIHPDRGLFRSVRVFGKHLFLGALHGTTQNKLQKGGNKA